VPPYQKRQNFKPENDLIEPDLSGKTENESKKPVHWEMFVLAQERDGEG
jgi:hypothetical protein